MIVNKPISRDGRILTGSSSIIEVLQALQIEQRLQGRNVRRGAISEDLINICDDCLDIRRAILRHELTNGLKILPIVAACKKASAENKLGMRHITYTMA